MVPALPLPENLAGFVLGAIDAAVDSIEVLDLQGRYVWVNHSFVARTGYTQDEAAGRTPAELLRSDAHDAAYYEGIWSTITSGKPWVGRIISRTKDGRQTVQVLSATPVVGVAAEIVGFVGIRRDLSSHDPLIQHLMQADRLAAVGQLAAGVAHEINNPLAYVLGNVSYVAQELGRLEGLDPVALADLRAALADIEHGGHRVHEIVRDLGAFSLRRVAAPELLDVRTVLDTAVRLVQHEIRHRAQLVRDFAEVPRVWAGTAELGQAFLNLLLNAIDAIPVGAASQHEIRLAVRVDERGEVVVEVADSGVGINAEVLPRIFDPFFTTKPVGKGTGLGLSMVHAVVSQAGGKVTVRSQPGQGARFLVSLPAAREVAPTAHPAPPADEVATRVRRQVLVVDDEERVLLTMRRVLEHCDLALCRTGEEALALLAERQFDVVLCDLMMPDLTGLDVYQRAIARNPELERRFVFITGGALSDRIERFLAATACPVLVKPFGAAELRRQVERTGG